MKLREREIDEGIGREIEREDWRLRSEGSEERSEDAEWQLDWRINTGRRKVEKKGRAYFDLYNRNRENS